jgi:hypothetical protein
MIVNKLFKSPIFDIIFSEFGKWDWGLGIGYYHLLGIFKHYGMACVCLGLSSLKNMGKISIMDR